MEQGNNENEENGTIQLKDDYISKRQQVNEVELAGGHDQYSKNNIALINALPGCESNFTRRGNLDLQTSLAISAFTIYGTTEK